MKTDFTGIVEIKTKLQVQRIILVILKQWGHEGIENSVREQIWRAYKLTKS